MADQHSGSGRSTEVEWITAFIDRPEHAFQLTLDFWGAVSGGSVSSHRGEVDEFATLHPVDGADPHLRVQRTASGSSGSHLDLHVGDVASAAADWSQRGRSVLAVHERHMILSSPGGLSFCAVAHHGESRRQTAPRLPGATSTALVDQVTIDADPDAFDDELQFWSEVTGWQPVSSRLPEFVALVGPRSMPLRLLLQRRQSPRGDTHCHLDLACDDVDAAIAAHCRLGASVVRSHKYWTVMADPSGTEYCLTRRNPRTGTLPDDR